MFLVDTNEAASDWQGVIDAIEKIFSRADAEVVSLKKWDERRLTYEIRKKGRGTYILTYFNADPLKITSIERDVQLSEQILRVMILTTDRMSQEDIDRETPVGLAEKADAEAKAKAEADAEAKAKEAEAKAKEAEAKAVEAPAEEAAPVEEASEPVAEVAEESTEAAGEEEAPSEDVAAEEETPDEEA
jgi:ribosomal protein S6